MNWDPNRFIEHGFTPTCRFNSACDFILQENGCATCEFANGLISDRPEEVALPHSLINDNVPIPGLTPGQASNASTPFRVLGSAR